MLWTDDLLRIRRYGAISRRPGQTLQEFFATENMAYADAVKAGVEIDPDRRAYHMFIKSGLTDDQINHIYGFVYDSEAQGPGSALDPRKIQEAVLRFYHKPWDVDRHRDSRASMGRYSRPLMGHAAPTHRRQTWYHPRSRGGTKGSYAQEPVNTIHPEPEIHEHIYVTKRLQRLRNIVHDSKHILNNIETNVTNNANDVTHTDELTVQH